jgi:hypothetical protein
VSTIPGSFSTGFAYDSVVVAQGILSLETTRAADITSRFECKARLSPRPRAPQPRNCEPGKLQFGVRVRIDFAVQADFFKLRSSPFH